MSLENGSVTRVVKEDLLYFQRQVRAAIDNLDTIMTPAISHHERSTGMIPVLDSEIPLYAGTSQFALAAQLRTRLQTVGGSVYERLTWFRRLLKQMDLELTSTIEAFEANEALNDQTAREFLDSFSNTITLLQNGPQGGGSYPGGLNGLDNFSGGWGSDNTSGNSNNNPSGSSSSSSNNSSSNSSSGN